jgi:chorismate mutase
MLHDEPGVLSSLLSIFAQENTNLLTINSITPTNGCALVTITAETTEMVVTLDEMLRMLTQTSGVIKAEVLAG